MTTTKRVSKYTAIAWACLLAFVVIVRGLSIELGGVKPEAVALNLHDDSTLNTGSNRAGHRHNLALGAATHQLG